MTRRIEALRRIQSQARGGIVENPQARKAANATLEAALGRYQDARGEVLLHEMPKFFRVAIFGSARLKENTPECQFVRDLTYQLVSKKRIDIVTGGGPGIMAAAHRGAKEAVEDAAKRGKIFKAKTHGVRIVLPFEEKANGDIDIYTNHPEFLTRIQEFADKTYAIYLAQGGIGTLLELAAYLQLRQTEHLEKGFPIIAHPFWKPMFDAFNTEAYHKRVANEEVPMISKVDLSLMEYSDSVPYIVDRMVRRYQYWEDEIHSRVLWQKDKTSRKRYRRLDGRV